MKSAIKFAIAIAIVLFPQSVSAGAYQLVDVDGTIFRVLTEGLGSREAGQPVIVFENGSASRIESWGDFPSSAAELGPVVLYDRSTVGESEWDGEIGRPEHVTANLWALLRELEVEPPYVLVGWSWGGDLTIQHARTHPQDVVGLVLIDPPLQSGRAELDILRDIGIAPAAHFQTIARMRAEMAEVPDALRADVLPILSIFERLEEPEMDLPPHIRTAGLIAGMRATPPDEQIEKFGAFPYDFQVHLEAKTRNRTRRLADLMLASSDSMLILLPNEGHSLHRHRPDLVLTAIEYALTGEHAQ